MKDKTRKLLNISVSIILTIVIVISGLAVLFLIEKTQSENNYKNAIKKPPSANYIEEDLEGVLVSKMVEVVKTEINEGDYIVYLIRIPQYHNNEKYDYYLVSYILVRIQGFINFIYQWKYNDKRLVFSE